MPKHVTVNADRLLQLDRVIAAAVCGDADLSASQLDGVKRQRRRLLEHFVRLRRCPTCGNALSPGAELAPSPADPEYAQWWDSLTEAEREVERVTFDNYIATRQVGRKRVQEGATSGE